MSKKRFGLRMQIISVTSLLVIFLAGNSIYNITKVIHLRNGYQFILESVSAKKNYLLELDTDLNRALFFESEFDKTLNGDYHDMAMAYLEHAQILITRLDELEMNFFDSRDSEGLHNLRLEFGRMRDLVSATRDKTVRKGLTRNTGLQGSLHETALVLEDALNLYGTDRMMLEYLKLRRYEKSIIDHPVKEDVDLAHEAAGHLSSLIDGDFGPSARGTAMRGMVYRYLEEFEKMVTLTAELNDLYSKRETLLSNMESQLETKRMNVEDQLAEEIEIIRSAMVRNRYMTMAVSGLALFLAVIMTLLLVLRIREPMRLALESVEFLARGDLTHKGLYDMNDEMGDIVRGINTASEALGALMRATAAFAERGRESSVTLAMESEEMQTAVMEIQANLTSIKEMGGDLSTISGKTLNAAENISGGVNKLDTMIASLSSGIVETTGAIEQMIANIQNVSDISRKKGDTVNALLLQARENGKEIHTTSVLIEEIAGLAQGIGEIIQVINGIASRTNLLAMNAAIEAAHAGDAGRGFAVVADEIRKLAESSGKNASQIGQMLGNIIERIERVAQSSQSSTGNFEQIEDAIQSFTHSFTEIVNSMEEMTAGSSHVLDASQSMKEELAAVSDMSGVISQETGGIRSEAENMDDRIFNLTQGINEIFHALKDITASSQKVAESARMSMEEMNGLHDEIVRFKTDDGEKIEEGLLTVGDEDSSEPCELDEIPSGF